MAILSTLIVLVSLRYLTFDPQVFFEEQRDIFVQHKVALGAHVSGAMLALLVGPWQFVPALRRRSVRLHRWTGYVYVSATGVGGIGGLLLAPTAFGGIISSVGFGCLGALWLSFTYRGLRAALSNEFEAHRAWMIRSFAMCFAAVTLRGYIGVQELLHTMPWWHVSFVDAYRGIAWLAWIPNLIVALVITRPIRPSGQMSAL